MQIQPDPVSTGGLATSWAVSVPLGTLSPDHQQYLAARGVPIQWALAHGYRTVHSHEAKKVLGRKSLVVGGGMLIPYTADYAVLRLSITFDGRKFLYPSGVSTFPYLPPLPNASDWWDVTKSLVICEGPVKAAALTCAGIPAIGLAGATGGGHNAQRRREEKITELHPFLLNNVGWKGRQVAIMMDSDAATNATVRKGEEIVATALLTAGAQPFIARTPMLPGHSKLGPDDFLMLVGPDGVRQHLSGSLPWSPPKTASECARWSPKRGVVCRVV